MIGNYNFSVLKQFKYLEKVLFQIPTVYHSYFKPPAIVLAGFQNSLNETLSAHLENISTSTVWVSPNISFRYSSNRVFRLCSLSSFSPLTFFSPLGLCDFSFRFCGCPGIPWPLCLPRFVSNNRSDPHLDKKWSHVWVKGSVAVDRRAAALWQAWERQGVTIGKKEYTS